MNQTASKTVVSRPPDAETRKSVGRGTTLSQPRQTSAEAARQKRALQTLQRKLAGLPVRRRDDDFSGRDHDTVLYGRA